MGHFQPDNAPWHVACLIPINYKLGVSHHITMNWRWRLVFPLRHAWQWWVNITLIERGKSNSILPPWQHGKCFLCCCGITLLCNTSQQQAESNQAQHYLIRVPNGLKTHGIHFRYIYNRGVEFSSWKATTLQKYEFTRFTYIKIIPWMP